MLTHLGRDKWTPFGRRPFQVHFLEWKCLNPVKISLKFVPKGRINNIPALVQIMAWRRPGDKPLSEPMMVSLPTHICVTRPQWVNPSSAGCGYTYNSICLLGALWYFMSAICNYSADFNVRDAYFELPLADNSEVSLFDWVASFVMCCCARDIAPHCVSTLMCVCVVILEITNLLLMTFQ